MDLHGDPSLIAHTQEARPAPVRAGTTVRGFITGASYSWR